MNDDLISRKELLKKLSSGEFDGRSVIYDSDGFPTHISLGGIKKIIRTMSTSFDKEKVIEELKSAIGDIHYTEDGSFNGKCIEDFEFIQAKTAIEIVEKGGIE